MIAPRRWSNYSYFHHNNIHTSNNKNEKSSNNDRTNSCYFHCNNKGFSETLAGFRPRYVNDNNSINMIPETTITRRRGRRRKHHSSKNKITVNVNLSITCNYNNSKKKHFYVNSRPCLSRDTLGIGIGEHSDTLNNKNDSIPSTNNIDEIICRVIGDALAELYNNSDIKFSPLERFVFEPHQVTYLCDTIPKRLLEMGVIVRTESSNNSETSNHNKNDSIMAFERIISSSSSLLHSTTTAATTTITSIASSKAVLDSLSATHLMLLFVIYYAEVYAQPPISRFRVAAAAIGKSGRIYIGVNVEFPNLPLSTAIHGEQCLVANAHRFNALLHIKNNNNSDSNNNNNCESVSVDKAWDCFERLVVNALPCGHCRQFLSEMQYSGEIEVVVPMMKKKANIIHISTQNNTNKNNKSHKYRNINNIDNNINDTDINNDNDVDVSNLLKEMTVLRLPLSELLPFAFTPDQLQLPDTSENNDNNNGNNNNNAVV